MIDPSQRKKRFSEKELLKGMTAYTAHADEVSNLSDDEWGV
jgi:hypothetical protein